MLRDPQEQWTFGQWENFDLLEVTLTGDVREVYSAFVDECNHIDRTTRTIDGQHAPSAREYCGEIIDETGQHI